LEMKRQNQNQQEENKKRKVVSTIPQQQQQQIPTQQQPNQTRTQENDETTTHKRRFHTPGVKEIVMDNLTVTGLEYWAGDESSRKQFDASVKNTIILDCVFVENF